MLRINCKDEDDFEDKFYGLDADYGIIYRNIVSSIEMAHNSKEEVAHFAEITFLQGDVMALDSHRSDWIENLTCALRYYESEKVEDFERCQMIVRLIERINKSYE